MGKRPCEKRKDERARCCVCKENCECWTQLSRKVVGTSKNRERKKEGIEKKKSLKSLQGSKEVEECDRKGNSAWITSK